MVFGNLNLTLSSLGREADCFGGNGPGGGGGVGTLGGNRPLCHPPAPP